MSSDLLVFATNLFRSENICCTRSRLSYSHTRHFALRVLLRQYPYDAMVDAITASANRDPEIAQMAMAFIERIVPWRAPYGPSEEQKRAAMEALREAGGGLAESLRDGIWVLFERPKL
jgi:hypothetical protein